LTAGTGVSGQELDVGSNDELFWMWVKRNQSPGVYFCRHDQFASSSIRQVMPIEPVWLLAAIGMVDIEPASVFDGPLVRGDGRVELRTWLPSATGRLPRVIVIDARRALVTEQYVYDAAGTTLLASAVAESHHYDHMAQVAIPERVMVRLPTAGLAFKIDLGRAVTVNQLHADPRQLWSMPAFDGYPQYDLSGAGPGTPLPGRLGAPQPLAYPPSASGGSATTPAAAPYAGFGQPAGLPPYPRP
jgi:hypothetical protein